MAHSHPAKDRPSISPELYGLTPCSRHTIRLKGALNGIAAALPYRKRQKAGHFINGSSVAGHKVGPDYAVYAAAKHYEMGRS